MQNYIIVNRIQCSIILKQLKMINNLICHRINKTDKEAIKWKQVGKFGKS